MLPGLQRLSPPADGVVRLAPDLRVALLAHACASPSLEVCGLIGGTGAGATRYYPVANRAGDPATAFLLDARGQIDAMRTMRARGEMLWGIFHSHPAGAPEPSPRDLAEAGYPHRYYVIAAPAPAPRLGVWFFDGRRFAALRLAPD